MLRPTESDGILKRIPFILLWKGPWCLVLESQVKVSLSCLPFPHPHFFVLASANEVKAQSKGIHCLTAGTLTDLPFSLPPYDPLQVP